MNKPTDTLAKLEALANRRRLAAVTPKDRCVYTFCLMAIQEYRKQQANSGEESTCVVSSPVGASACVQTEGVSAQEAPALSVPPFPDSQSDIARAGSPFLDSVSLSSEKSAQSVGAPSNTEPTRRQGQRA